MPSVMIALLFVVTTINYMDRNLLGVLKPTIQGELHFSESEFGQIVFAFSIAYAIGYASMGAFTDKVGVRHRPGRRMHRLVPGLYGPWLSRLGCRLYRRPRCPRTG